MQHQLSLIYQTLNLATKIATGLPASCSYRRWLSGPFLDEPDRQIVQVLVTNLDFDFSQWRDGAPWRDAWVDEMTGCRDNPEESDLNGHTVLATGSRSWSVSRSSCSRRMELEPVRRWLFVLRVDHDLDSTTIKVQTSITRPRPFGDELVTVVVQMSDL